MRTVNVAVVGFGTVGTGVVRILLNSADALTARTGLKLNLKAICDIDIETSRGIDVPDGLLTSSLDEVLADDDVEIVCELVGGTTVAYDVVEKIIASGKSVVTANKALLAERGMPLMEQARDRGVAVSFEAAVAGGIPLVAAIRDGLVANRISSITGILNGTSNYILTKMSREGASYADALAEAQASGYAEADPTLDVGGGDSAHKLTILSWLAFGKPARYDDVHCEGIQSIKPEDIRFGLEMGYAVKLLAIGELDDEDRLCLRVHPAFVDRQNPLAHVGDAYNAITVHGDAVGDTLYYGMGAGQMPTASAVVADIVDTALGRARIAFVERELFGGRVPYVARSMDDIRSRYYLRFDVSDAPGVLGHIAGVLGSENISIASVLQHESSGGARVPLVILTHEAQECHMQSALKSIRKLDIVHGEPVCLRLIG